jgi:hypothetical protein
MAIVSCQKSDMKPGCHNSSEKNQDQSNNTTEVNSKFGASSSTLDDSNNTGIEIVGSGDDDRDGGDGRKKKSR